mgnify:CR=1 FL=1
MAQITIAPHPSYSNHGGIVIGGAGNTTIPFGGQYPALLEPAIHICRLEDHGVTIVFVTGFTTVNGLRVARTFDFCGCGAYIISGADNTTSD